MSRSKIFIGCNNVAGILVTLIAYHVCDIVTFNMFQ